MCVCVFRDSMWEQRKLESQPAPASYLQLPLWLHLRGRPTGPDMETRHAATASGPRLSCTTNGLPQRARLDSTQAKLPLGNSYRPATRPVILSHKHWKIIIIHTYTWTSVMYVCVCMQLCMCVCVCVHSKVVILNFHDRLAAK